METNKKKFTDWHLYFGCPCKVFFEDENGKFTVEREGTLSWDRENDSEFILYQPLNNKDDFDDIDFRWKPILRPLSSISKVEIDEYIKASSFTQSDLINRAISDAEGTKYLLSKSFDLFHLIESGLAIDS